jgi:hypothetical protein
MIEGFSHFVTSMTAPIASGWSIFAGWDLHPLESAAFHGAPPVPPNMECGNRAESIQSGRSPRPNRTESLSPKSRHF